MAVPSAFFVGDTGRALLSGRLPVGEVWFSLTVLFAHNVAMSGLPEEFFYRVFVQTRLSQVFRSELAGLLTTSLLFGLVHVPYILQWYPDTSVLEAFSRAFFVQGFTGLLLGVLWQRTRSLIPGVLVHSGVNAVNGLSSLAAIMAY